MEEKIAKYVAKKYSASSVKSHLYYIKRFTNYYGNRAATATYQDILAYLAHLRKNYKLHPKTLRNCLFGVKIYFHYLLESGQRNEHPCSELVLKDKQDKSIQVDKLYHAEQLEKFYENYAIKGKKYLQNRNKIIIGLLIYQALSVSEIASLVVEDIDLEKGEIRIKGSREINTKSPQSRTLPLQAKQILLIHNYLQNERKKLLKSTTHTECSRSESSFIISKKGEKISGHSISRILNGNRGKSERLEPKKIRQSVIANLLKAGNDTRLVQVFAGHKRASTTQQYQQSELDILRASLKKYHPLA
ncbi:MAG: tyrosine-type recombinase/integrase [Chitinophagales bacterium]|nr:tyrosine-type recombinase/integrase [Bacteroidota bacterium]